MNTAAIDRLTRISSEHPLIPDTYVPWNNGKKRADEKYLPDSLVSVHGLSVYDTLTHEQKEEIARHEVVQFMYSYAWGESLLVNYLGKRNLKLQVESSEYRFILREIIEEARHQEMFLRAIAEIEGKPIRPTGMHFFWSRVSFNRFPSSWMFMVITGMELMADEYGRVVQKDKSVYNVFRKMAELHQIEEGRHIHFAKMLLEEHLTKAGFFKRTTFSVLLALNIHFMRTLYVREEIYVRAGVPEPRKVYREAKKHYRKKFAQKVVPSTVDFVKEFNGFNFITRPFWKWLLKAEIK